MKISRVAVTWAIATLLVVLSVSLFLYDGYRSKNFVCNSEFTVAVDGRSISVFSRYIFSDGMGQLDSTGVITDEKQQKLNFSHSTKFSYRKMNDIVVLISHDNNPNVEIMSTYLHELPDFYNYTNRSLVFKMYNTGMSSMILAQGGTPFLFCKKNKLR